MSKNNTEEYKHYTEVCEELGHFWIQKVAEFSFQFKLKNKQFWGVAAEITEHHLFLFFFSPHNYRMQAWAADDVCWEQE